MNHRTPTHVSHVPVNWSDPELASLLNRSDGWQLDNRGGYAPQNVDVFVGWSSAAGRPATLVWERGQSAVVAAAFPIGQGEHVRVERHMGGNVRILFGVVIEGREGFREDDVQRGIRLYWLRVNTQKS
ncbi:hypothetical protein EKH79_00710 [Dyella dinghuensis]|uniref:PilZ domain-containing protein n=1 Tax=Dyella dinghuensis TaxID=1920169 RepID=A0A432LXX4_9GAMM|nr:hypothetical protein [Dyella dinghuensis]RUL67159.1 hypothetical protein EKH79_00710 [Dyella dinghuensis]